MLSLPKLNASGFPRKVAPICVLALVGLACTTSPRTAASPVSGSDVYDVIIEHGHIVDGTGNPWFAGDVAVKGDHIARITSSGLLAHAQAKRRIDARDLVVAPGFIDIQGQSGYALTFGDSRLVSKITQGVTTEILGEGSTPAPVNDAMLRARASEVPGPRGDTIRRVTATFAGEHGFGHWLDAMQAHAISVNTGSFVGAETIRVYAKGFAEGAPTPAELDTMRAVTRNAMRDGAFGVASALIYPPGGYATTEELIEIAKAMAPYGGVYITHMRSEGDHVTDALDEAMQIGKEGGVPVEIYHLKAAGVRNWPQDDDIVAKIEFARAFGQDVAADMYPYTAGATSLSACVPPWATEGDKLLDNLADPAAHARILDDMHDERATWENLCGLATPHGVMVVGLTQPDLKAFEGRRIDEIAKALNKDWAEVIADIVLEEGKAGHSPGMIAFLMSDENVAMQLSMPWMKIGTDAAGIDPDSAKSLAHPRSYGTYPRILGRYVRQQGVMPLEEAVRKMSSAVANRLSLQDRGVLREGMKADIAVFDPVTIIDKATYAEPHQLSVGVKYVFVNGVAVVDDGKVTGAKPGRVLRGPGFGLHP